MPYELTYGGIPEGRYILAEELRVIRNAAREVGGIEGKGVCLFGPNAGTRGKLASTGFLAISTTPWPRTTATPSSYFPM